MITNIAGGFYPMATVGNLVWEDANNNGEQDSDEQRIANVMVEAFDMNNEKVGEDVTNANGEYIIEYLGKNSYYLKFTPPAGYGFTIANAANESKDSDVDHSNGVNTTSIYAMEPGDNFINVDAGLAFGALPLQWGKVSAIYNGKLNEVRWSTQTEINTQDFDVERHTGDGIFETIGHVKASGNSSVLKLYAWDDENVHPGKSYFYRIKQNDLDGRYTYSNIVEVHIPAKFNGVELYPNPAFDQSTLSLILPENSRVKVDILSYRWHLGAQRTD